MSPKQPKNLMGLHHLALNVHNLGMKTEWKPDADNIYLTSGSDNLALHRLSKKHDSSSLQRLDHLGFIIDTAEEVDSWHNFLSHQGIEIKIPPRTHRDGAKSFYCMDPDGNTVQMIYHPPLSQDKND